MISPACALPAVAANAAAAVTIKSAKNRRMKILPPVVSFSALIVITLRGGASPDGVGPGATDPSCEGNPARARRRWTPG